MLYQWNCNLSGLTFPLNPNSLEAYPGCVYHQLLPFNCSVVYCSVHALTTLLLKDICVVSRFFLALTNKAAVSNYSHTVLCECWFSLFRE